MPTEVAPGESMQATVNLHSGQGSGGPDNCSYNLTVGGVGVNVTATMVGTVQDSATQCVPNALFGGPNTEQVTLGFDAPTNPDPYEVLIEARGNVSGNLYASETVTIDVLDPNPPEPPDPSYDAVIETAPSSVVQGENFQIHATATCNNGPCPEVDHRLAVGGVELASGTMELADDEQFSITVGPEEVFINSPGEHVVTWEVGNDSESQTLTVDEREIDQGDYPAPPEDPPDDPDSGSDSLGLAALAGVGAAIAFGEDDENGDIDA